MEYGEGIPSYEGQRGRGWGASPARASQTFISFESWAHTTLFQVGKEIDNMTSEMQSLGSLKTERDKREGENAPTNKCGANVQNQKTKPSQFPNMKLKAIDLGVSAWKTL